MLKNKIKVRSPITVANLGCGFDILGMGLEFAAEELVVIKNSKKKIAISKISGAVNLPADPKKNVASVAVQSMLDKLNINQGFEIEIKKMIKPGSGLGSSAASSAAAVVAVNELLGNPFTRTDLIEFAMNGEKVASGAAHADNVAPAILGGITLIRSNNPLDVIQLPVPKNLYCVILYPHIEIKTKDARGLLKKDVSLKLATKQWGNIASLIVGFFKEDYELISRSIVDYIVEPQRKILIKGFDELKISAINAGALGCSISGSGPSVFALCDGLDVSKRVLSAMKKQYSKEGILFTTYSSKISLNGVEII